MNIEEIKILGHRYEDICKVGVLCKNKESYMYYYTFTKGFIEQMELTNLRAVINLGSKKMKNKLTNEEIILEVYRRMYRETDPKADIDEIIKTGKGKEPNWGSVHKLTLCP